MSEPQPFTDNELAQARNAPLGWTARRWLATVDALRAALAARPQPLFKGTGIELDEWMADQATSDLVSMRAVVYDAAVAGSATPTKEDDDG